MQTQQPLTINVPSAVYESLKRRAEQAHRSVEEEAVEALVTAVPEEGSIPSDLAEEMRALGDRPDTELWTIARQRLSAETVLRLEQLHVKRRQNGLADDEARELDKLTREYERQMLLRAQAAALLRQRGHDVAELLDG